ncbi:DUF4386 family protein [Asanoa sp. NPDC050611]|uniref:DUF4386 family protein n=1 Tax=Asanoa sp. NPDC050611 TaxID=3157098 RepID=UPI0034053A8C
MTACSAAMCASPGPGTLVRQFIRGDAAAAARIVDQARTSADPVLLAAAALIQADPGRLDRTARAATGIRDRQLVAIAAAHLRGDRDSFRAHQGAVTTWFTVLALSAALFAPIAIGIGRLSGSSGRSGSSGSRAMRAAVSVGIAAAVVQVIGLARWSLLVPGFAADAADADPAVAERGRDAFALAHLVLGNIVGETLGYLLTAAWTLLVLAALRAARWFTVFGALAAVLVLAGVLSPLDLPGVDLANFVGYVLWSLWLVAFAVQVLRGQVR